MTTISRVIYLGYYVKETDWKRIASFMRYVAEKSRLGRIHIWLDMLFASLKYNISFIDYFCFRFWEKKSRERAKWAGTGFMYEYQAVMNPKSHRSVLDNKILFLRFYAGYATRKWATIEMLQQDSKLAADLLTDASGRIVLKNSRGQCGKDIQVIRTQEMNPDNLIQLMLEKGYDLAEGFVIQHSDLMRLSSRGLNTIRIITQLHQGKVKLIAARLRITIHSDVDNLAAGNVAAAIDLESGVVSSEGVYSDITKANERFHPVTQVSIPGFQIPLWNEVLEKVKQIALEYPQNKSVGWDIAITETGVEFIEGNHNWCKLLWQLPVGKGLKEELTQYSTAID